MPARSLARVNRKTAAYFFHRLRQIIARRLEDSLPVEGLAEVDEKLFWRRSQRQMRARRRWQGPCLRHPQARRQGHHRDDPDVRKGTLLPILQQKVVFLIRSSIPTTIPPMTSSTSPSSITHRIDHSDAYVLARHNHISYNRELLGARPSARSADTTAFRKPTFPSLSTRPNFASTTKHPASNCDPSNAGPNARPSQPDLGQPQFSSLCSRCRARRLVGAWLGFGDLETSPVKNALMRWRG